MPTTPIGQPSLRAAYEVLDESRPLDDEVLTAVVFGADTPCPDDPRCLRVDLDPLAGPAFSEVWRGGGRPRVGTVGPIRYVEDGEHLAASIDVDESRFGGLLEATEAAYLGMLSLHAESPYRHVWRIWNIVAAINEGRGDDERYRQFCLGRARAFAAAPDRSPLVAYPAASAVGKRPESRSLQVCWIAGREPGIAVENPRQLSAYHYPRRYGPAAPSFSRAMVVPGPMFLISGTSSIVGHASLHDEDIEAQVRETLVNLDMLLDRARASGRIRSARMGGGSLVKAYVRRRGDAERVRRELRDHFGESVPTLILAADICRSELLIEIEVAHGG
jgi:chorismate lyase / 3-hydroxybenzoate synthase